MALTPRQLDDLVELTYDTALGDKGWEDLSMDNQEYIVAERWLKNKKKPIKSSTRVLWKAQIAKSGAARQTGPYQRDVYQVENYMIGAYAEWALTTSNYIYDDNEEDFQSNDADVIVDALLVREHAMYNGWFQHMEEQCIATPASSSENPANIQGLKFWIQKYASATPGFLGGDPSGFSSGAGNILTSSYSKWKNWAGTYSVVSRDDLVAKLKKAIAFTGFKAPHSFKQLNGARPQWEFYTVWDLIDALAKYLDARKTEQSDLAGVVTPTLGSIPVVRMAEMERSESRAYDTSNPFYGVNWSKFNFAFHKGKDMVRRGPIRLSDRHTVAAVHVDSTCQMWCTNRREGGFVISRS